MTGSRGWSVLPLTARGAPGSRRVLPFQTLAVFALSSSGLLHEFLPCLALLPHHTLVLAMSTQPPIEPPCLPYSNFVAPARKQSQLRNRARICGHLVRFIYARYPSAASDVRIARRGGRHPRGRNATPREHRKHRSKAHADTHRSLSAPVHPQTSTRSTALGASRYCSSLP
ncbi:hypothetical protein BC628DRAFT_1343863 [Trametes gibbosa]|nr:hypothetical protein BC628DRAFT_1343863 [Trametes gibbosa]